MILDLFREKNFAPVDPSDFESITMVATLQNTTSGLGKNKSARFTIHEILPYGLTIDAPPRFCALGHHLLLEIEITLPKTADTAKRAVKFRSTVRVKGIEASPPLDSPTSTQPNPDRIIVDLLQYDEKSWESINELIAARQKQINQFLSSATGSTGNT